MTPEERFLEDMRSVLEDIQTERLSTPEKSPIRLKRHHVVGVGITPWEVQKKLLLKLERDDKAINLLRGIETDFFEEGYQYIELELTPAFRSIYQKYHDSPEYKSEIINSPSQQSPVLIANLDRRYKSFIDIPEHGFFSGIADYVKYLDSVKDFEPIIEKIKYQENKDEEKIVQLERQLKKDMDTTAKELLAFLKTNKTGSEEISLAIEDYNNLIEGRVQSVSSDEEMMHSSLVRLVNALYDQGHKDFVKTYVTINPKNDLSRQYHISSVFDDYQSELKNFRALRKRSVWGAWDKVTTVFFVVHDYVKQLEDLKKKNSFWLYAGFMGMHEEMEDILNDKPGQRTEFRQEKYIIHINRVHNYFVEILSSQPTAKFTNKEKSSQKRDEEAILKFEQLLLNLDRGLLQYSNNKPVHISLASNPIKFLILLLENNGKIVKYEAIHDYLNLPGSRLQNAATGEAIKEIKRELVDILVNEVGISRDKCSKIIKSTRSIGYKISSD